MPKQKELTDEQVELEIKRLTNSEPVRLARAEMRAKYRRRQYLYQLRSMEKRGLELQEIGRTIDTFEDELSECEEF